MYSWLRSAVFDHDLLFFNEWQGFGMIRDGVTWFKEVTPLGTLANHWWIGTAVLTAPAYLAALSFGSADGFFGVVGAVLAWSSVAFVTIAAIASDDLLARYSRLGAAARIGIWAAVLFGTPLFWYSFRFPLGTHGPAVAAVAVLSWLLLRTENLEQNAYAIGLAAGLAVSTRLQHVVLLPAIAAAFLLQRVSWRAWLRGTVGGAIPVALQAVAWWIVYGSPLGPLTSGANLSGVTWMPFQSNRFLPVLFSSYHGLFSWAPLTLLAVIGWLLALRSHRTAATVLLLMFGGELVANATFDRYWWGGMSFGPRRFVDLAVPFAIGVAWFQSIRPRVISALLVIATTGWSVALTLAALSGGLELSRYVSGSDLLVAVRSVGLPHNLRLPPLRDTVIAIVIVFAIAAVLFLLRRRLVVIATVYLVVCLLGLAALWRPTRARTAEEINRHGIHREASRRWGPLTDQRGLLSDELAFLEATDRRTEADRTRGEIARIDRLLAAVPR